LSIQPLPYWASHTNALSTFEDQVAVSVSTYEEGVWRDRVLLRTPSEWATLGPAFSGRVETLAWYDGELYAGGDFDSVGTDAIPMVARWDGSTWRPVGEGLPTSAYSRVQGLAEFRGELVAGGEFGSYLEPGRPRAFASWDGTRWAQLGVDPPSGSLVRLRRVGLDLCAVGNMGSYNQPTAILRWDGTTWHTGEDSLASFVYDVAEYQGERYAGGTIVRDGSRPATTLVRNRNGRWEPPQVPSVGAHGLLGTFPNSVVSVPGGVAVSGGFHFAGAPGGWVRCPAAALWNGIRWSSLGLESFPDRQVTALVLHEGVLHATGRFYSDLESGFLARLEDGGWRIAGSDAVGFWNAYCLASVQGHLFVGGSNDNGFHGLTFWDGSVWQGMGGGITRGDYVTEITGLGDEVIVAGSFEEVGGIPCRNIAAWNPSRGWRALGEGLDRAANAVLSVDGDLYVAGYFTTAGGNPAAGFARWRDGHWEPLPEPASSHWGYGYGLGWFDGKLVACGDAFPGLIAMLQADSTWHPLGAGLDAPAFAMVQNGPSLFVAGFFSRAGDHAAYGFAELGPAGAITPQLRPLVTAAPNPFAGVVSIQYELTAGTRVRVEIFDITGKLVDRAFDGFQGAGPQVVTWRPSGIGRAGVYFARVDAAGSRRVLRVARVE
jgi:hypothetical protein